IYGTPAGTLLVAAESGMVFRSEDRGESWTVQGTGYTGPLYGVLPIGEENAQTVLAFGFGGRLFLSTSGGAKWVAIGQPEKRATFVAGRRLASGEVLLLGQDASLWRSADTGR